jgi:hypothetical protein
MPSLHPKKEQLIVLTKSSLVLLMTFLVALSAGCATETPGQPPAEASVLSTDELRSLIERAAASRRVFDDSYNGGLTYAFLGDGRLAVTSRFVTGKVVPGKWRVDAQGARLCTRIEEDAETCARVHRLSTSPERYYIDVEGRTQRANTVETR